MSDTLEYIRMFAQLPLAMRRFLSSTLTLEEARRIVAERIERREENFLRIAQQSIYSYPRSPYLALLKLAGCEFGDLSALVKQKGLEAALSELFDEGVYVTFEEFKGRKPIVRNGHTIQVQARDFDNPFSKPGFALQTGGSTGLSTTVNQDFSYIVAGAPHHLAMLAAWDMLGAPMASYIGILPGSGFRFLLQRAYLREKTLHWYSSIGWRDSRYWLKYDIATLFMTFWARANGAHIPWPEPVPTERAEVIARWIRDTLRSHSRCLLYSIVSPALRVCMAAEKAGFDLRGATFRLGGEPITPAKVAAMERVGVRVLPTFGSVETGSIALGCAQPIHTGEVHLLADAFALFTHPYWVEGTQVSVPAFCLTSLLDSSPKVMLNYQSDDYGIVEERKCNCAFDAYGFTTHLSEIRSYSKLVGEGVNLIGNEMMNILEHVLPARFGGTPLDYQLMEQEDERGFTRLYLNISPRLEITDEQAVLDVVLRGLRDSSPMGDATRSVWQRTDTIQIRRIEPVATGRGKLYPLHIQRVEQNGQPIGRA